MLWSDEIGHWRLNHTVKNLLVTQVQTFLLFWLFGQTLHHPSLAMNFGFSTSSTYISLLIFQFLYSPIAHLTSFLMNVLSRRFEFQADASVTHLHHLSLSLSLTAVSSPIRCCAVYCCLAGAVTRCSWDMAKSCRVG